MRTQTRKERDEMNYESIREFRTVTGEEETNSLLATGKWCVINLKYEDDGIVATLARIKA